MSKTSIEWCARPGTVPETWNPTTGCNKVSRGCKFCYAEIMHRRLQAMGQEKYKQPFLAGAVEHHSYDLLTMPLSWKKPRTVFVNSMSDLFHKNISFSFIDSVFAVMALATDHTFIICTKRADIMYEYYCAGKDALIERWSNATYEIGGDDELDLKGLYYDEDESYAACWISNAIPQCWPLPNVWLLVSTEDQLRANERIPLLLQTPAAVHGISCEPLIGPVDLKKWLPLDLIPGHDFDINGEAWKGGKLDADLQLNWVICGGESGNKGEPMHPDWARSLRDQCNAAEIPFFFKQWGEYRPWNKNDDESKRIWFFNEPHIRTGKKNSGRVLDGREYNQFPEPLNYSVPA